MNPADKKQWFIDTVTMVHEQGYRVTPVFQNGTCKPYGEGQTYVEPHHYAQAVAIGVVMDEAVLLDWDGNKADDSGEDIVDLETLGATLGLADGLPDAVQEGSGGRSLHYLFRRRKSDTVRRSSCDGWLPHIDLKTNNQLMILKAHKIITDNELPAKSSLPYCPEVLVRALNGSEITSSALMSVPDPYRVDTAIRDLKAGVNLHSSAMTIANAMIFEGRSEEEILRKFNEYSDDINQRDSKRVARFYGGELQDIISSGIKKYGGRADNGGLDDLDALEGDGTEWDNYVFVESTGTVRHVDTGAEMSVSAFNIKMLHMDRWVDMGDKAKKVAAIEYLREVKRRPSVFQAVYAPHAGKFFEFRGKTCINSYQPDRVPKADPDWELKPHWRIVERHFLQLFPTEVEGRMVIQWMAYNVQKTGSKILWAPIIVGVPGDGKSTIANILRAVMGDDNVWDVSSDSVFSQFNAFAGGAAVCALEEIRVKGHNRHDVMNKLKPLVTNPVVEVVRKGKDGQQVPNATNYIAFSNHGDAMALDEDDRRWGVFFTRFGSREQMLEDCPDSYWDELHDAYRTHPEVIRGWLESVPLDGFPVIKCPDLGGAKRRMIAESETDEVHAIKEAAECLGDVFEIKTLVNEVGKLGCRVTAKRAGVALKNMGFVKTKRARFGGVLAFMWVSAEAAKAVHLCERDDGYLDEITLLAQRLFEDCSLLAPF